MTNDERKPKAKMTKGISLGGFGPLVLSFFRASSLGFRHFRHV
jgi:hypothetical protein